LKGPCSPPIPPFLSFLYSRTRAFSQAPLTLRPACPFPLAHSAFSTSDLFFSSLFLSYFRAFCCFISQRFLLETQYNPRSPLCLSLSLTTSQDFSALCVLKTVFLQAEDFAGFLALPPSVFAVPSSFPLRILFLLDPMGDSGFLTPDKRPFSGLSPLGRRRAYLVLSLFGWATVDLPARTVAFFGLGDVAFFPFP